MTYRSVLITSSSMNGLANNLDSALNELAENVEVVTFSFGVHIVGFHRHYEGILLLKEPE